MTISPLTSHNTPRDVPQEDCMAAHTRLKKDAFLKFCRVAGYTKKGEIAAFLKVPASTVGRVLSGKYGISGEFVAAAMRAFPSLDYRDLFEAEDDDENTDSGDSAA